jgi:hypothetical protein
MHKYMHKYFFYLLSLEENRLLNLSKHLRYTLYKDITCKEEGEFPLEGSVAEGHVG